MTHKKYHLFLLIIVILFLTWSGINPYDRFVWWLEIAPFLLVAPVLFLTYRRFPLSDFTYTLIAIHTIILAYGGHTTYARAPLGEWMKEIFGFTRNNYDKIGHFVQGLFPFIYVRELLLRTSPLRRGKWLGFISICIPVALSALYEIIEWGVSIVSGSAGDSFLGTQGYIWDTQSDMFLCMLGAIVASLVLSRFHDWSLNTVREK